MISSPSLPVAIITQAAELLVYAIQSSLPFSSLLANDFTSSDGYNSLVNATIEISTRASKSEQFAFPIACSRLMFVNMAMSKREGIPNMGIVQYLIRSLEKCSSFDMRSVLLGMIRDIVFFAKRDDRVVIIFELNLYGVLLPNISRFSLGDREVLLKIVDLSIEDGTFSLTMRKYLGLMLDSVPSVVLLIARHTVSLLSLGKVTRPQFRESGLTSVLIDYFRHPSTYLNLTDRLEVMTALSILNEGKI